MWVQNCLESAQKFNFWTQNLQIRHFFIILAQFDKAISNLIFFIAISAHNSAQNFIKLNSDDAKKKSILERLWHWWLYWGFFWWTQWCNMSTLVIALMIAPMNILLIALMFILLIALMIWLCPTHPEFQSVQPQIQVLRSNSSLSASEPTGDY